MTSTPLTQPRAWNLVMTGACAVAAVAWPLLTGIPAPWLLAGAVLLISMTAAEVVGRDRWLFWIVTIGVLVKIWAAATAYYFSLWHVPFLQHFQLGDGFWSFAPDSVIYDRFGAEVARAWQWGLSFPTTWETVEDLSLFSGAVYYVFGRNPLNVFLINAGFATAIVVFALLIVRQFEVETWAGRSLAAALAFWPSLILWSTQLLKDPPMLFLLMAELYFGIALMHGEGSRVRRAWLWAAFVVTPLPIWVTRSYLAAAVVAALAGALSIAVIAAATRRGTLQQAWRVAGMLVVFGASLLAASQTDYIGLLRPRNPVSGYMNLAVEYREVGRWAEAAEAYRGALNEQPAYQPARAGLADALVAQRQYRDAGVLWENSLPLVADSERIGAAYCAGEMYERDGEWLRAENIYRRALEFDPTRLRTFDRLQMAIRRQGRSKDLIPIFAEITKRYPNLAEAYFWLGEVLRDSGFEDEARVVVDRYERLASNGSLDLTPFSAPEVAPCGRLAARIPFELPSDRNKGAGQTSKGASEAVDETGPFDAPSRRPLQRSPAAEAVRRPRVLPDLDSLLASLFSGTATVRQMPDLLGSTRRGIAAEGGGSLIDRDVQIGTFIDMAAYLPRGLLVLYWSPFPGQWFTAGQATGRLRAFSVFETLFVYLILPLVVLSLIRVVRRPDPRLWMLATLVLVLGCVLAVAVPNVGTLFRLRLQVLFPMLVLVVASGAADVPVHWLRRTKRSQAKARAIEAVAGV